MARQAEFDAYDRRRQKGSANQATHGAKASTTEELQQEIASMGQEISSLLECASGTAGVEVSGPRARTIERSKETEGGSDSDSSDSSEDPEGGEVDVLGMEDEDDDEDDEEDGL